MASRISVTLSNNYGKLIGILPDEIINTDTENDLRSSKLLLDQIIQKDLSNLDQFLKNNNFSLPLQEFSQQEIVITRSLTLKDEPPFQNQIDEIQFYVAQWWIRKEIVGALAQVIIDEVSLLRESYRKYNGTDTSLSDKRRYCNEWIKRYQHFNGYAISIHEMISDYHDMMEELCCKINPTYQKAPIYAWHSDIGSGDLLSGAEELLLKGNRGRLTGFPLIRSAMEIVITRNILDIKKSIKFKGKRISFKKKIPDITSICDIIDSNNMGGTFDTNSIRRLYTWTSIVSHRGYRVPEAMLWYVLFYTTGLVLPKFANVVLTSSDIDIILEALKNQKKIDLV